MKKLYFVLLVCFPLIILSLDPGTKPFAAAAAADEEDDDIDDDDADVENETEDAIVKSEVSDEEDGTPSGSPDAATTILFTKPVLSFGSNELPAGHIVEFLVGFQNKGKEDFTLESLEASFRFPMDFNYHIQNFSALKYNKVVKPTHEATLAYSFKAPESFAGRPLGLNVLLKYKDFEGSLFGESVFNETVYVVELEDGMDGETFFLYVFLAAMFVLLLVISQQFLTSVGMKRVGKKPVIETGTSNPNAVDYGWLPQQMVNSINKQQQSPKSSPHKNSNHKSPKASKQHQSPKQRKAKKAH